MVIMRDKSNTFLPSFHRFRLVLGKVYSQVVNNDFSLNTYLYVLAFICPTLFPAICPHCALWTHVLRPVTGVLYQTTNHVGIRSLNSFIPCAQDRVLSSAPSMTVVIGADSSGSWELTERSRPQTVEGCTRMDGTDCHLDLSRTREKA